MTTYRAGTHHGVTICVEGDGHTCGHPDHDCARGHLVAVIVNGDWELAERICQLLNYGCTRVGLHNCRGEWRNHDHEQPTGAPPGPLSSTQAASGPPGGGSGCPDGVGAVSGRYWGGRPAHPTCIETTPIDRAPWNQWLCGPDCPREPERKADQP